MIKKCPRCESIAVVYEDYVGGTSYYRCQTCGYRGSDFELPTVFDQITQSTKTLAESVVYSYEMAIGGSMFRVYWTSPFVENLYPSEPEAIAATVARLNEVAK